MPAAGYAVMVAWLPAEGGQPQFHYSNPEDGTFEPEKALAEARAIYAGQAGARARRLVEYDLRRGYRTLAHDGQGWEALPAEFNPGGYY